MSPDAMTWSALLAKWTEFARASVALPDTPEGERWKGAVPAIIGLQAITQALAELAELEPGERAVGLDKSEVGIKAHTRELHELWRGEPLPEELALLIGDARLALRAATAAGLEWTVVDEPLVVGHPGDLLAAIAETGFRGDLLLPTPGVPLFPGSPAAFLGAISPGSDATAIPEEAAELVAAYLSTGGDTQGPVASAQARQVYRQFDFSRGGPVRDLVRDFDADLPPGQPQLVLAVAAGEPQSVTLPIRGADQVDPLPVEFDDAG